jgi:hypothetical protein
VPSGGLSKPLMSALAQSKVWIFARWPTNWLPRVSRKWGGMKVPTPVTPLLDVDGLVTPLA